VLPGMKHNPVYERVVNPAPSVRAVPRIQPNPQKLRERFMKVVASRGYSHPELIVEEYFVSYMQNVDNFVKMLEKYESGKD
jgi:hypothetical protein